jgi:uncharacterized membrane protein YccC
VGLATGRLAEGVTASAGALIVGFANLGGGYRIRGETLLATTLAAGAGALLGGFAGPRVVATVVLIGVWGFAGGLLVSLGRRAAFVGLLSTWALLLAGDLHLHGDAVAREAWLITAGGLVQTLVAVAAWPLRPFAAERHAIADAYRALAAYARAPSTATLQSTAGALAAATDTVGPGPAAGAGSEAPNERAALRTLVEQGEWVRVELAALARSDAPGVKATLRAAAGALDAIAIQRQRAFSLATLERSAQTITEPVARGQAASLVAWIAAAGAGGGGGGQNDALAPSPAARRHPIRALRAELTLRSGAFRHAARLSGALIVAVLAYRSLSLGSGYWVPLTVLFVLKPDYGTTVARSIGRIAGTTAGVTIAWALITALSPSDATIVALLAVLAAATYTLFPANYALSSVVLTVLIALLVEFSGGSPVGALLDRVIDTAVGGAIALSAIALWPTPEAPETRESLAALVTAEGHWLDAILRAFSDGDHTRSLRTTRLDTRQARAQARESVQRALAEPPRRRPDAQPLHGTLTAMDEISECALVLTAAVHNGTRAPRDTLSPYRNALSDSFQSTAASLRDDTRATPPLPRQQTPALPKDDPAFTTIATEALTVLAVLQRLDHTRRDAKPPSDE